MVLSSGHTAVTQRRQATTRTSAQENPPRWTSTTQTECSLPRDLSAVQLLPNEQAYNQQKAIVKRQFQELRGRQARYEQEATNLEWMEDRLARVKDRTWSFPTRKIENRDRNHES